VKATPPLVGSLLLCEQACEAFDMGIQFGDAAL
jgi:hypothetical protein